MGDEPKVALDQEATTSTVSVRIPEFIPEDPEFWLAQVEAQFIIANIRSERQKFYYLSAAIPRSLAPEVRDLVVHPPTEQPYTALRDALLRRTAVSEERRINQVLEGIQLDGRTPSQLLRYMRQQAGAETISESFLRQLWLKRLPDSVQSVISIFFNKSSLDELAEGADSAMEFSTGHISSVMQPPPTLTKEVLKELRDLRLSVQNIAAPQWRPQRRRSPSRNRRSSSPRPIGECWYHRRYRDQARKCQPPCRHYEAWQQKKPTQKTSLPAGASDHL
jgi:hypothetical protein